MFSRREGDRFNRGRVSNAILSVVENETVVDTLLPGASDYTVPALPGNQNVVEEAFGTGGNGAAGVGAGGGPEYVRNDAVSVTGSEVRSVTFGAVGAGDGDDAGDSTLGTLVAKGGKGGTAGGAGGTGGTGDVTFDGGAGAVGVGTTASGGGGGSAGAAVAATAGPPDGGGGSVNSEPFSSSGVGGRSQAAAFADGTQGFFRATYLEQVGVTFGRQVGLAHSRTTGNVTTTDVTLPSGDEGDTLVAIIGTDGTTTISMDDWVEVVNTSVAPAFAVFKRIATGSDPVAIDLTISQTVDWTLRRYRGIKFDEIEGALSSGSSTTPTPPLLTLSTSKSCIWLSCSNVDNTSHVTAFSATYGGRIVTQAVNIGGSMLLNCTKKVTAISQTPGVYTISTSRPWSAATIALPKG